jgi:hypothetical protein
MGSLLFGREDFPAAAAYFSALACLRSSGIFFFLITLGER